MGTNEMVAENNEWIYFMLGWTNWHVHFTIWRLIDQLHYCMATLCTHKGVQLNIAWNANSISSSKWENVISVFEFQIVFLDPRVCPSDFKDFERLVKAPLTWAEKEPPGRNHAWEAVFSPQRNAIWNTFVSPGWTFCMVFQGCELQR